MPLNPILNIVNLLKKYNSAKYLIIDAIKEEAEGYKYKHKIKDFKKIGSILRVVDVEDGVRNIILIELGGK